MARYMDLVFRPFVCMSTFCVDPSVQVCNPFKVFSLNLLRVPTIWITVRQGPTALAVGTGWNCLHIFTLIHPFSPLFPSLWETARYRLKYCLKGPLNPKQPTNQPYPFAILIWKSRPHNSEKL